MELLSSKCHFMWENPNSGLTKAGLGHKGHVAFSATPVHTRVSCASCQSSLSKNTEVQIHTPTSGLLLAERSVTHMMLLTRVQSVPQINQVSLFFHKRETWAATHPTYPTSKQSDSKQFFVALWRLCPTLEIKMNWHICTKGTGESYN